LGEACVLQPLSLLLGGAVPKSLCLSFGFSCYSAKDMLSCCFLFADSFALQVRALQSSPYKSDADAFAAMATATDHLCRAYLATATAAGGQGGLRELSAARMQLRGLLKQCEEAFGEQQQYKQLRELLQEVLAAEDAALAAKRAAEAATQ
jgi:hypothetical protein